MTTASLRTEDFNYDLPESSIAQEPMMPRDHCKLLVMNRTDNTLEHRHFYDIVDYFDAGDLLVVNDTRVLPARLQGKRADTGGAVEVLLLKELDADTHTWECLVKPGKRVREGVELAFFGAEDVPSTSPSDEPCLSGTVVEVGDEGLRSIRFAAADEDFHAAIHKLGTLPLPPYIKDYAGEQDLYQTVYARQDKEHSAAAPTAGLHFTPELLQQLQDKGVEIARVRLDVGLDTFRPVSEDDPTAHHIHTEYFQVPAAAAGAVNAAHDRGNKVVAVGTTVVRALESAAALTGSAHIEAQGAPTSLYILPGYDFQVVDALITNFHVPKSTLVMMISAFVDTEHGRERTLAAYAEAVEEGYRFLSFGDAMLIWS
ncbi:MAG: tRNA preQ1(34) S-adenosylmethionine ribosyltransferase-isomerase QueA [Coriobacteriia bacterium]|nr:tRNA preQ1(34) S-adenosylmethionine ribosyltransferase-isomerase QueA [Coriobacteriia bacterium]MCL2537307.1 tRNA preQ1(34) S-adenosylmethionine ribosyltransferase-isomerase QueA [Coriobacteriia bacterium]